MSLKVLETAARLDAAITALATRIDARYASTPTAESILVVCVLKSAVHFFSDLTRKLHFPMEYDFIRLSSYGNERGSSGEVRIVADLNCDVRDRRVLIVEDVVDTGTTLHFLQKLLLERGAKEVCTAVLVDKPKARKVEVQVEFRAIENCDKFLVGYGFDNMEADRNLPDLCYIDIE